MSHAPKPEGWKSCHWNDSIIQLEDGSPVMELICNKCLSWVWVPAYEDRGMPYCWMPTTPHPICPKCGKDVFHK